MSRRNYDRWPAVEWRRSANTVGKMRSAGWEVISYCRTCHLMMRADLALIELQRGPEVVLWNRQTKCRRIGCSGIVEFQGKPPQLDRHIRLFAEWPP